MNEKTNQLAINGGAPAVNIPSPHCQWPPKASDIELNQLAAQRNQDICIKGNAGPVKVLEESFLDFLQHQVSYAVAVNSGTTGLLSAYVGIGIEADDEVIVPALTYHAAVSPLFILRAKPVLVDIDYNTRCINPDLIESAITEKTKAITVVHQWGHPGDMDKIMAIAKKHKLRVIEDCSHAHGSQYKGMMCGTIGDVAVFSLQANKTIFAGEGGMVVTKCQHIHERILLLGHNRDRAKADITSKLHRYWVTGFGLKLRISPFNAITAIHSLQAFPERKRQKHRCLNYFSQQLKQFDFIDVYQSSEDIDMGAWYGFKPVFLPDKLPISRCIFIRLLRAEGVELSPPSGLPLYHLPLFYEKNSPLFNKQCYQTQPMAEHYPVAELIMKQGLSFPPFHRWPEDKKTIDAYIQALHKIQRYTRRVMKSGGEINENG